MDQAGLEIEDAATIVSRGMSQLVLSAIEAGAEPRRAVTHVVQNLVIDGAEQLDPTHFVELIRLEQSGDLTATQAKQVLGEMVAPNPN